MRIALALAVLLLPVTAAAQDWYDADELLVHVHEAQRADLAAELEVSSLSELPLYDLHVSIPADLEGFGLRETIWVTNTEARPMRDVVLRIFSNVTAPASGPPVHVVRRECLDGVTCAFTDPSASAIRVRPSRPIPPGGHLRIQLDVQGVLRELDESQMTMMAQAMQNMASMEGGSAGSTDYGLLAHGQGIGSFANFFAVLARRDREHGRWSTADEGTTGDLGTDAVGNVRARIVLPQSLHLAVSGSEVQRVLVRDPSGTPPRVEVTVYAGVIRDFALLAGATLESGARRVGQTLVRSYFLPEDRAAGLGVLDVTAHALEIFEARFGPYPYTELDVVEAPLVGGAGGVEFTALVTVASMFYRPAMAGGGMGGLAGMLGGATDLFGGEGEGEGEGEGDAPEGSMGLDPMQASILEFVTAHEAAHQWWHGIVGSDSRRHPFVDESLAQYSAMLYFEDRYGAERAAHEGERQVAMNFHMMRIQGHADGAVDRAASAFASPIDYAGLVYGKGPYMYRALRSELGDADFFAGMRSYVSTYRMRIAPPRGVIDILAQGTHAARVRALAHRWLEERHGNDDLGPSTTDTLLAGMLPPEIAENPEMRAMLGPLLQGMLGGDGGGGGGGGLAGLLGGGGGGDDISPEMLQQIEQLMGGGGMGGDDESSPGPRRAE